MAVTPDDIQVLKRSRDLNRSHYMRKSEIYKELWSTEDFFREGTLGVKARGSNGQRAILGAYLRTSWLLLCSLYPLSCGASEP